MIKVSSKYVIYESQGSCAFEILVWQLQSLKLKDSLFKGSKRGYILPKHIQKHYLNLYHQPHKMVKHIQTIRRQFTGELCECV